MESERELFGEEGNEDLVFQWNRFVLEDERLWEVGGDNWLQSSVNVIDATEMIIAYFTIILKMVLKRHMHKKYNSK